MFSPSVRPLLVVIALAATACSSTVTGESTDEPDPVASSVASSPVVPDSSSPDTTSEAPDDSVVMVGGGPEPATLIEGTAPTEAEIAAIAGDADEPDDEPDEVVIVPVTRAEDDRTISVLDPPLEAVGQSSGENTRRAQERLLELGFWLQEANGDFEKSTAQAVMAFQKYTGLEHGGRAHRGDRAPDRSEHDRHPRRDRQEQAAAVHRAGRRDALGAQHVDR